MPAPHPPAPAETLPETLTGLDFHLPPELEAGQPPEARGLARDQVRLMVSYRHNRRIFHTRFNQIACFLRPGDLLVINTSATLNAAVNARRAGGMPLEVRLSTRLPAGLWSLELRRSAAEGAGPFSQGQAGETLQLEGGGEVTLLTPYRQDQRGAGDAPVRLWIAALELPLPVEEYLEQHGFPIRYPYVHQDWPNSYYQTVYANEPGSAEMPSAGRAFTPELITQLVAGGVQFAPLVLHTGVASLEAHEPPYEEYYRVPADTARAVHAARQAGKRVIAVGTTVVRALETVAAADGSVHPGEGWTGQVVTPRRGIHSLDGLLTGLHEPRSSHLAMLAALAGEEHLRRTYAAALKEGYLWHEFGDLHLILP
ncbi:MAG: S-adenosylmethionine:tRNA ribosyltransferase-isomerase [Anaerolineaceae bacterium]|nr:S-adenosylmethionine:tRNA ribosyltransferase-isomerase [Anaerolineaceae bacterium]